METGFISVIIDQNARSILVNQSVGASGNNDIHPIDIFQFTIFFEFLTVGKLLSGNWGNALLLFTVSIRIFYVKKK